MKQLLFVVIGLPGRSLFGSSATGLCVTKPEVSGVQGAIDAWTSRARPLTGPVARVVGWTNASVS
jgi:hypothetical protein